MALGREEDTDLFRGWARHNCHVFIVFQEDESVGRERRAYRASLGSFHDGGRKVKDLVNQVRQRTNMRQYGIGPCVGTSYAFEPGAYRSVANVSSDRPSEAANGEKRSDRVGGILQG